jgi:hypothetical protein
VIRAEGHGLAPEESVFETCGVSDVQAVGGFLVSTKIPMVGLRRGRPLDPGSRRRRAFFARHPYRCCFCCCSCGWFCHWFSPGLPVLARQLRGPHLRTCPWCSSRSSMAETAALSPSSFPQSSTGLFDVIRVLARSYHVVFRGPRNAPCKNRFRNGQDCLQNGPFCRERKTAGAFTFVPDLTMFTQNPPG